MKNVWPKQKISTAEKLKLDPITKLGWGTDCVDFFADQVINGSAGNKQEVLMLLKACEGHVDEEAYQYVLNPYNIEGNAKTRRYPAKLRNYDFLSIVFETALGEKANQPDTSQVTAINPDTDNKLIDGHNKEMDDMLMQDFINNLVKSGIGQEAMAGMVEDYKKKNTMFYASLAEKKAMDGQMKLKYLKAGERINDKFQRLFEYWCKVKQFYSYKSVNGSDVELEIVPPHEGYAFMSSNSPFVEDGFAFVRTQRLSINEIVDKFHREIAEQTTPEFDPLDAMEEALKGGLPRSMHKSFIMSEADLMNKPERHNWNTHIGDKFDVHHVAFKTFVPVIEVDFIDPISGEKQTKVMDEDYKFDAMAGDIEERKMWVDCVWEGWRVDMQEGHHWYPYVRRMPIQRNEIENSSMCKLPYNGLCKLTTDGNVYSWATRGLTYQVLVNILRYQMEKMINKHRDKVTIIPKGLIPTEGGWDEEKFIYWMDAVGVGIVDETNPNFAVAAQALKVLDMSLGKYISEIFNLCTSLQSEFYQSIGFFPQRFGDVKTTAGKQTTQDAIVRSFVTSQELFREFGEFEESELNGLMDYSKVAWLDGKQAAFVDPTGKLYAVDVDGLEHAGTQYGIFVRNASSEARKLSVLENWGFSMAQNDREPELLADVLDAENVSTIKNVLRKYTAIKREFESSQQKELIASQERVAKMVSEDKRADREAKDIISQRQSITDLKKAMIMSSDIAKDVVTPEEFTEIDAVVEAVNRNKSMLMDSEEDDIDRMISQTEHADKMDLENRKLEDKKEERKSKEKIAGMNKN